jgi:hypothetical protein
MQTDKFNNLQDKYLLIVKEAITNNKLKNNNA